MDGGGAPSRSEAPDRSRVAHQFSSTEIVAQPGIDPLCAAFRSTSYTDVFYLLRHQKSAVHHSQRRYDRNGQINSDDPADSTADHYCEYREQRVNLELMAHDAWRNKIIH